MAEVVPCGSRPGQGLGRAALCWRSVWPVGCEAGRGGWTLWPFCGLDSFTVTVWAWFLCPSQALSRIFQQYFLTPLCTHPARTDRADPAAQPRSLGRFD